MQIPPKLAVELHLTLDNFKLAELLCEFMLDQHKRGCLPTPTEVKMYGIGTTAHLPGKNCGFFTTPVIHGAIIDIRRSLEFLMLQVDRRQGIISRVNKARPDDFLVTDLGIAAPTVDQFLNLSMVTIGKMPSSILLELVTYANKHLAHFSKTAALPDMQSIIDGVKIVRTSILIFVYDKMDIQRPPTQPVNMTGLLAYKSG